MVVVKGRGPPRFWWISFLSREVLVFVGPCRFFFLGGFCKAAGSITMWILF